MSDFQYVAYARGSRCLKGIADELHGMLVDVGLSDGMEMHLQAVGSMVCAVESGQRINVGQQREYADRLAQISGRLTAAVDAAEQGPRSPAPIGADAQTVNGLCAAHIPSGGKTRDDASMDEVIEEALAAS